MSTFQITLFTLFSVFSIILRILAFSYLIKTYLKIDFKTIAISYLMGFVFNLLLPFRMGELIRALYLGRKLNSSLSIIGSFIIIERLFDLIFVQTIFFFFFDYHIYNSFALFIAAILIYFAFYFFTRSYLYQMNINIARIMNPLNIVNLVKRSDRSNIFISALFVILSWMLFCLAIFSISGFGGSLFIKWLNWNSFLQDPFPINKILNGDYFYIYLLFPFLIITIIFRFSNFLLKYVPFPQSEENSASIGSAFNLMEYFKISPTPKFPDTTEIDQSVLLKKMDGGSSGDIVLQMKSKNDLLFIRKIATNISSARLEKQFLFISRQNSRGFFPKILQSNKLVNNFYYDIEYLEDYNTFSNFISSNQLTSNVLDLLFHNLELFHGNRFDVSPISSTSELKEYFSSVIQPIVSHVDRYVNHFGFDSVRTINSRSTLNLNRIFYEIQSNIQNFSFNHGVDNIHGDLTFSNLMISGTSKVYKSRNNSVYTSSSVSEPEFDFKFIDPNPNQLLNSRCVDLGKILQSSIGKYETLFNTKINFESRFNVNYQPNYNLDNYKFFNSYLDDSLSSGEKNLSLLLCFSHFIRLLPYQIRFSISSLPIMYLRTLEIGMLVLENNDNFIQYND